MPYFFSRILECSLDDAISRVTASLSAEGFGILSDIDVASKLHEKLGVDMPAYRILGACNPPLAHQALQIDGNIGLLMPCNVVLRDLGEGRIELSIIDPRDALKPADNDALTPIAEQAAERLVLALEAL